MNRKQSGSLDRISFVRSDGSDDAGDGAPDGHGEHTDPGTDRHGVLLSSFTNRIQIG